MLNGIMIGLVLCLIIGRIECIRREFINSLCYKIELMCSMNSDNLNINNSSVLSVNND